MHKRNNTKSAYTLIELIVVISIIMFLTVMTYVPYNFYSNKEKVRLWAKEISQTLSEARNMAINWLSNSNSNLKIWIYFDKNTGNKIRYLSYPYSFSGTYKVEEDLTQNIRLIKEKQIPEFISINKINDKENMLFLYDSITWDISLKTINSWLAQTYTSTWILEINFWFKWADSGSLTKTVKYNTKTFITDY